MYAKLPVLFREWRVATAQWLRERGCAGVDTDENGVEAAAAVLEVTLDSLLLHCLIAPCGPRSRRPAHWNRWLPWHSGTEPSWNAVERVAHIVQKKSELRSSSISLSEC